MNFEHEQVVIRRGPRCGLPIVVAVHSTALGQALGGCRFARYPSSPSARTGWRDGLADALRLSTAMTEKCALAGLPNGGGKTVVALPPDPFDRPALLNDVGDVIAGLSGAYATGPDVGTAPEDMLVIASRTPHVFCRPEAAGGSGDSSVHTAAGVLAALQAVCTSRFGAPDLSARSFAVLGLGRVGSHVLRMLAATGARVLAGDIDPTRRPLALAAGATWLSPQDCLTAEVDVVVPAALGGVLTPDSVPQLRCTAVAGPANNQLDAPATAELLHQRGILWAPDVVVSAGGIIHATAVELHKESAAQVTARIQAIADTLTEILQTASSSGTTPAEAAHKRARERIEAGTAPTPAEAAHNRARQRIEAGIARTPAD